MKHILILASIFLSSCSTPEKTARLSSIVQLALTVAERRNAITAEDAQAVRDAGSIILTPAPVITPTGK